MGPYRDLDSNACGDTAKSDGEVFHDVALTDVLCKDDNNDGKLDLSFALTWKQNTGSCTDPDDSGDFLGGTSSKCVEWIGDVDTCSLPKTIDPGNTYNFTFINTLQTKSSSLHTNTVTASAFYEATTVEDSDSATVEIIDTSTAAIGQIVWQDLNGDGISQENEPGIDGVTIDLKNAAGVVIATTTTSQGGEYTFLSLIAGSYQVVITDTDGALHRMVLTGGVDPHDVALADGQIYTDANFGYARASISVSKQATPSAIHAPGDLVSYTITVTNTGPIGIEVFELVDTKFGLLHSVGTCGDFLSTPEPIAAGDSYQCEFDKNISGAAGATHSNTVTELAGDINNHLLFGADDALVVITDSLSAAVGDLVWLDMNGNGIVDVDEPGIDGVTLELWHDSAGDGMYESLVDQQVTINNGYYNFTNLAGGAYQVRVTDMNNALLGMVLTGGVEPHPVNLGNKELYPDANFGYFTATDASTAASIPTLPLYLLSVLAGLITLLAVAVIRALEN